MRAAGSESESLQPERLAALATSVSVAIAVDLGLPVAARTRGRDTIQALREVFAGEVLVEGLGDRVPMASNSLSVRASTTRSS